jgi:NAD-dependent deacetylase
MESVIDRAVEFIQESSALVALTGAGISTDSGIPDFRSPTGIWSKYSTELGNYRYFEKNPELFFKMAKELLPSLLSAVPNKGHIALKDLEGTGTLKAIITQNIDGLHQEAGSERVIEIHGTYKTATCLQCSRKFRFDEILPLFETVPVCPDCSGIIKPDVIMFGEKLPREAFLEAVRLAEEADLMIVAGSRLEVYPASHLVLVTKKRGGRIIIINDTRTALDNVADILLREPLSVCLPEIVNRLKEVMT